MDLNTKKEEFSRAYLQAVAVMADAESIPPKVDRDSIDVILKRVGGRREQIEVQLKCTADAVPEEGDLSFDLPVKNYNDLRLDCIIPSVLIVVYVPADVENWLAVSEQELTLRKCGWWISLKGMPETENSSTVRITLPRENLLTPEALKTLFDNQSTFQPI